MSKFKALQTSRRFMSSILRIDIEHKDDRWMKFSNRFFKSIPVHLILFIQFSALISSVVKILNQSNGFTVRLAATYVFIALSQAITMFLNTGVHLNKIVALYRTLQTTVDSKCKMNFIPRF